MLGTAEGLSLTELFSVAPAVVVAVVVVVDRRPLRVFASLSTLRRSTEGVGVSLAGQVGRNTPVSRSVVDVVERSFMGLSLYASAECDGYGPIVPVRDGFVGWNVPV